MRIAAILLMFASAVFGDSISPMTFSATIPLGQTVMVNKVVTVNSANPPAAYSTVSLGVTPVPAGLSITISPASFTGAFDRSATRTFNFTVSFTGTSPGVFSFVINGLVDGVPVASETDNIAVTANPPAITKSFANSQIQLFGPDNTALTFTITNPNSASLSTIAFTDTLPSGLIVSTPNGLSGSCGGGSTITAVAGTNTISLSGGLLAGGASCTFSVNVNGIDIGVQTNTTSAITAFNGTLVGSTATASISVTDLFFYWFFAESGGGARP